MKKTITLLGATGKVGGKIAEILLQEGHYLKLIAKTADNLKKFKNMGAEVISSDITDVKVLTETQKQLSDKKVQINNMDEAAENLKLFLEKQGLINDINQFEMIKNI